MSETELRHALSLIVQDAESYGTGDPNHVAWAKAALNGQQQLDPFGVEAGIALNDARNLAAEITTGITHSPWCDAPMLPCVRCRAEDAEAKLRHANELLGTCEPQVEIEKIHAHLARCRVPESHIEP